MIGLPTPSGLAVRVAVGLGMAAACFLAGWTANGWRLGSIHEAEALERAAEVIRDTADAQDHADALQTQLARVDADATARLRRLNDENDSLRHAATTGGVRVNGATCPDAQAKGPDGAGVGTGTGAELDEGTRQVVYDYRARLIRAGEKLNACQAALGELLSPR